MDAAVPARFAASLPARVNNTILANIGVFYEGKTLVLEFGRGVPPYRKLTLAEAFDIATV